MQVQPQHQEPPGVAEVNQQAVGQQNDAGQNGGVPIQLEEFQDNGQAVQVQPQHQEQPGMAGFDQQHNQQAAGQQNGAGAAHAVNNQVANNGGQIIAANDAIGGQQAGNSKSIFS